MLSKLAVDLSESDSNAKMFVRTYHTIPHPSQQPVRFRCSLLSIDDVASITRLRSSPYPTPFGPAPDPPPISLPVHSSTPLGQAGRCNNYGVANGRLRAHTASRIRWGVDLYRCQCSEGSSSTPYARHKTCVLHIVRATAIA